MKQSRWNRMIGLIVVALLGQLSLAQEITTTSKKPGGVYAVGEKIAWTIDTKGGKITQATYVLKKGGLTPMGDGKLDLSAGPQVIETTLDQPGNVLLEIKYKAADKDKKKLAGAVVEPEKITVSAPKPDDFDTFWADKIKQLQAIPANPKLEPVDAGKPAVEYFKLTMDNINGSHIYGQLAKPKKPGKYPALLLVQWAGVYGLPKSNVLGRAENGWLALNIMAHDLPFDQPKDFYDNANKTTHKDYITMGNDDRDKSYFLRMYLSCYRAAEYLATHPDWDGQTLVVMGTSQGGQQSFVTAGLHPKITAMIANVPAGCDVTGEKAGRSIGFPYWASNAKWKKNDKILETGRYFDAVNFAHNIKCPVMVSMGLIDETCPPAGVLAAVNVTQNKKERLILEFSDHHGNGNAQALFWKRSEEWLRELAKGKKD